MGKTRCWTLGWEIAEVSLPLWKRKRYNKSNRLEVFCKNMLLEILQNSRPATLLKKRLWHNYFPVNFAKFLTAPFFTERLRWLLLIERKRPKGKSLESSWAVSNGVFMNNRGPSHTWKGRIFFFITFAKKFIVQITWNTIPYHWHLSPVINHYKLLALLFFFLIFPAPIAFFVFWFPPDDRLREKNKT